MGWNSVDIPTAIGLNFHLKSLLLGPCRLFLVLVLVVILLVTASCRLDPCEVILVVLLVVQWAALWHAAWAAHACEVTEASKLTSHGLEHVHARCAARGGAGHVGAAKLAAELACHALDHALGVAVHARCAQVDAWGVADSIAAFALGPASLAWPTAWALDAWLGAAVVAALQRARVASTQLEAWALVAASHGARAISEMALEASAPLVAA